MPTKDYNSCFNIQNRDGICRRPWKSCHQIPYFKSRIIEVWDLMTRLPYFKYRSRILIMVAFHLSEQVFMIFKNETIRYMMIIIFVLLVSWNWMYFLFLFQFELEIHSIKFVSWLNVINVRKSSWMHMWRFFEFG